MPPTLFPSPSLPLPGDACCLRLSGFPPSPAPAFLGPQQTFLVVICRSALLETGMQCSFDPKIVGGVFHILALEIWFLCSVLLYRCAVLRVFFILASYGPKGISGDQRYCTVLVYAVCV
jgi:hypothetical protein